MWEIADMICNRLGLGTENIFIYALAMTLAVFGVFIALGLVMRLIAEIITTIMAIFLGSGITFVIVNYLTFPGTIIHELSHAAVAFVTGAEVTSFSVIPSGLNLGSVEFKPRGKRVFRDMQITLASAAPVIVGTVLLWVMYAYIYPNCGTTVHYVLYWYMFASIFFHMTLSIQDILNIVMALPVSIPVIYVTMLVVTFVSRM
ncbi:MAG: hypothetical protein K5840_08320 [Eubacterium sp.]|nr:hypothetical protein [Eubacterium sp.]